MDAAGIQPVIDVVAVDGPGGTGKGTLCLMLARQLGWHLLDSGALYRVLAVAAGKHGLELDDEPALARLATALDVTFKSGDAGVEVMLEGADVTDEIRSESCGNAASRVAAFQEVRSSLLGRQRDFRQSPGLVADGRDMGTVVFPDALLKVFLTASQEERAKRRHKQLKLKGISVNLPHLLRDIAERDERDSQRSASPLRCASDAIEIDTTGMSINEVLVKVTDLVHERMQ